VREILDARDVAVCVPVHVDDNERMTFFPRLPVDETELIIQIFERVEILDDLQVAWRIVCGAETEEDTSRDAVRREVFRHDGSVKGWSLVFIGTDQTGHTYFCTYICTYHRALPVQGPRGRVEPGLGSYACPVSGKRAVQVICLSHGSGVILPQINPCATRS
jgi:hypothetical protein